MNWCSSAFEQPNHAVGRMTQHGDFFRRSPQQPHRGTTTHRGSQCSSFKIPASGAGGFPSPHMAGIVDA
jgi:hypothetical protein